MQVKFRAVVFCLAPILMYWGIANGDAELIVIAVLVAWASITW